MIENENAVPTHIDLMVPTIPEKPKKKQALMTRVEIANTISWAHKDDIDFSRLPKDQDMNL